MLHGIKFNDLKETNVDTIFQAFIALAPEPQARIEAEFQEIDTMSCQGGVTSLIDEAHFHSDTNFPEALSKIDGFHGKTMWTFIEHPEYWAGATLFLHSDNISESMWKKRNDLPHLPPKLENDDLEGLSTVISNYFHNKEGRGRNCKVEVFRRHEKEYFFAYPEDFAQSGVEWVRNKLDNRARHPAFEIIFVYTQDEGSLDIYAPRNTKSVPQLQKIFAQTILGLDDLDEFGKDKRVYELDALANRDFIFKYPANFGIEEVAVKRLRLSLKYGDKRRVTVEVDPSHNSKIIYDLLDELKLPEYYVTQVEIKVVFTPTPETRSRIRSFNISYPNWCALRHDGKDLIIRNMLIESGLEPREPEKTANLDAA